MQDSYLEESQEQQTLQQPPQAIPYPNRKMYNIEFPFMLNFKKSLQKIQSGIQSLLIQLTKCKQQNESQKKRLPYNILRSFQKHIKQLRCLLQKTKEENKIYEIYLDNREKQKIFKNMLFKKYLRELGNKRQEMKQYMNKVETRVRKLEDSGYAQFVEYDVVVPEVFTIRFSYSQKVLLGLVVARDEARNKVILQIARRKELLGNLAKINSIQKKAQIQPNEQLKEQEKKCQQLEIQPEKQTSILLNHNCSHKTPLFSTPNHSLPQTLQTLQTCLYFKNDNIMGVHILEIHNKKQQLKLETQRLKQAIKSTEQLIFKTKLKNGVQNNDPQYTKTDTLILLKQMQVQIKDKIWGRLFFYGHSVKRCRSKSWGVRVDEKWQYQR